MSTIDNTYKNEAEDKEIDKQNKHTVAKILNKSLNVYNNIYYNKIEMIIVL